MTALDPLTTAAYDVIASAVISSLTDDVYDEWGCHPEIGEDDWSEICDRVQDRAKRTDPGSANYDAAYAHLKKRCEDGDVP